MAVHQSSARPQPLVRLYEVLAALAARTDGPYHLADCTGRADWPHFGLYVFFTPETEFDAPPADWWVSRIGTVGVREGTGNSLWARLRQHRGNVSGAYAGGGNHRGSIFRRHVGSALIERDGLQDQYPKWGEQRATPASLREREHALEERVSTYIRSCPFLYVDVPGEPAADNARDYLETNLIALVSQLRRQADLSPPEAWLGRHSPRAEIRRTGLWNVKHVNALYDPDVVHFLSEYLPRTDSVDGGNEKKSI